MGYQSELGNWTDAQNDLIVAEYFAMMEFIPTAERGMKARRKRQLNEKIGRGIGSIDFKLGNVSAVAQELGLPPLPGFVPAPKFQNSIVEAFDRYLELHPEAWGIGQGVNPLPIAGPMEGGFEHSPSALPSAETPPGISDLGRAFTGIEPLPTPSPFLPLIVESAPAPGAPRKPRPAGLERLVRKYNPAARDHRNRALGRLGEEYAFRHEVERLTAAARPDLARKVEWTSQERGDGAGYDIKSFHPSGAERLIEVKATRGARSTPFFLTRTEREVSEERPEEWRLHRLYELAGEPKLFRLKPPLETVVTLQPETWRAWVA